MPKKTAKPEPANRDLSGKFVKGVSGNPSGRAKVPEEVKKVLKANTLSAVQTLVSIMENPTSEPKDRIKCAEIILNKTLGRNYQIEESIEMAKQKAETDLLREKIRLLQGDMSGEKEEVRVIIDV